MKDAKQLFEQIIEHLGNAVGFLAFVGYSSLFALCDDARDAFVERPVLITVIVLGSAALGYALCAATVCSKEHLEARERARQADADARARAELAEEKRREAVERLESKRLETAEKLERDRQKKLDTLARMCASMSTNQKRLVSKALDEGGVDGWIFDPELLMLRDMGILVQPSVVSRTNDTHFTVQPAFVLELREHREEWLS